MDATHDHDLSLLRRFEPVIFYTRGERFFPMDVERYIRQCSLWLQPPNEPPELLVPQGELTVEKLAQVRADGFGSIVYLKFIEPLDLLELARYTLGQAVKSLSKRNLDEIFRAGRGRLARVGYASRFVDALFSLTLFLRGRVPGDTAAAAALAYSRMQAEAERFCYYGRVARESGWVALQYWFFYPFNNWRSGFFGVNDHEGDWEMVMLYLSEKPGAGPDEPEECRLVPQWVAYASHDYEGDDLRRRWDDPELTIIQDRQGGQHPVIFAGAGSHASYFSPGEYLSELELPFLSPLVRIVERLQDFWVNTLRLAGSDSRPAGLQVFRVPFVDYARGDGLRIGPEQPRQWEPHLLEDDATWALDYRGLWGWYARDPIAGENAPAGPVYNRDGSVRRSWYDPLGWAGLDKVAPATEALGILHRQRQEVAARLSGLQSQVIEKSADLLGLGIESAALQGQPHLENAYQASRQQVVQLSNQLAELRRQVTIEQDRLEAFDQHEQQLLAGDLGPARAHIRRAHIPSSDLDLRWGWIAEVFAAISIGMVMVGLVLLIAFFPRYLAFGLAAMIGVLIFVEAGFRRRLSQMINSLVIGLAIVSVFVLLFEFFWQVVVALVLTAGVYIMWENVREIRS